MKKKIDIDFCFCNKTDDTERWSMFIDESILTERSIRDIKARLDDAFRLGMECKAKEIRECLQIKETISLK